MFYGTSTPKGSYSAKTGVKLPYESKQSPLERRGAESSLPMAHHGYQVLSDILFRLGLIANALTQCSA